MSTQSPELAEEQATEAGFTEEILQCPVHSTFRADRYDYVTQLLRSRHVWQVPDVFAENYREPTAESELTAREFVDDILFACNGQRDKRRRKLMNGLVRPEALDRYRDEVALPALREEMERLITEVDGRREADLVALLDRVFLKFSARFIGLTGVDSEAGLSQLQSYVVPIFSGLLSKFFADRAAVVAAALEAKRNYVRDFYRPSLEAQRKLLAQVEAGELSDDEVPRSLMYFIATGADPDYADEEVAIRETLLMFVATVGTSTQGLVWATELTTRWLEEHPEDAHLATDVGFLTRALEEAVRLKGPFVSFQTRVAATDIELDGARVEKGQEIHNMLPLASRDPRVFGEDGDAFNPHRTVPAGIPNYGLGFGTGPHQCLGLRVVLGNEGKGGSHLHLLRTLMEAGIRPDPDNQPMTMELKMGDDTVGDLATFITYPVVFTRWR